MGNSNFTLQFGFSGLSVVTNNTLLNTNNTGKVIVVSRSVDENVTKQVVFNSNYLYSVEFMASQDLSFEDLMKSKSPVVVISFDSFLKIFKNHNNLRIISSCRKGLIEYSRRMKDMNASGIIVSFDNDPEVAIEAQKILGESFIVKKGVPHAVVSSFKNEDKRVIAHGEHRGGLFVFPPECNKILKFKKAPGIIITKSQYEFDDYVKAKVIFVNGLHTIACLAAYKRLGFTDEVGEKAFCDIPEKELDKILDEVLKAASSVWMLSKGEFSTFGTNEYDNWILVSKEFIKYLFSSSNEKINRGIKLDLTGLQKIEYHKKYLGNYYKFTGYKKYFK